VCHTHVCHKLKLFSENIASKNLKMGKLNHKIVKRNYLNIQYITPPALNLDTFWFLGTMKAQNCILNFLSVIKKNEFIWKLFFLSLPFSWKKKEQLFFDFFFVFSLHSLVTFWAQMLVKKILFFQNFFLKKWLNSTVKKKRGIKKNFYI
jgi:hypothetical protein